jgi:hypothetical protein
VEWRQPQPVAQNAAPSFQAIAACAAMPPPEVVHTEKGVALRGSRSCSSHAHQIRGPVRGPHDELVVRLRLVGKAPIAGEPELRRFQLRPLGNAIPRGFHNPTDLCRNVTSGGFCAFQR